MKTQIQYLHFCLFILIMVIGPSINAQDTYQRNTSADVQDYVFGLTLNDASNSIKGEAEITVDFKNEVNPFTLDLIAKGDTYGMQVTHVFEGDKEANYSYEQNKINITPSESEEKTRTYKVVYEGIPERGLVIDTTKFGQRSFFGDNWPNLARHWLPSVDHPSDKATIEFRITAPDHYDVVATGEKIEESNLGEGLKLTTYKEPAPVAMKVVTIGVTKFASKLLDEVYDIPVSAWVYPENRLDGFSDYGVATKVLKYFIDNIGPYSYAKLANMQAKTQWGGLENAGTIAYFENSVTGKNEVEGLIAHEIAHQWFGNSASENDWNHVWLSEGFATYFAILYQESIYGNDKRKEELELDRKQIIDYYQKNPSPIVDPSITDPMKVLSTNTYQKGGWVLNMLRHKLGDEFFWKGIKAYYKAFQNSNAMTVDFRKIMEQASGEDLEPFFQQWLFIKGYPELKWDWNYNKKHLQINLTQVQKHHIFKFPIEIGVVKDGEIVIYKMDMENARKNLTIKLDYQPDDVVLDPESWLLFEEKSN
ncbi:M1 family metallopeptidase [Zobellia sp. 1_MG-2023]|uniref:M1 family metallopeptidase n=1 Tax=Zobellia sp. 1_MG-2023 TaxID=3062626 RepID=UPI0026E44E88|nr:M1 family metallopeptidase [Zobellia sp. 1_MG-2023]MDO6817699.1 M1 family metallopeptidase [Zobellia sp. 1_MG-2023]